MNIIQPVYQKGLSVKKESHLLCKAGAAKLDLGKKTTKKKKHTSLFCAALPLTLCVWRMCGEPRLAFCWPFKFKIQSLGPQRELRPRRGAGANSSSWHTWRYPFLLVCSRLLLLLLLTPLFPPSRFVPSPKPAIQGSDAVCSRHGSQEMPSQSTKLRRACVSVCKGERVRRDRDC